jgi:hypothetical protein
MATTNADIRTLTKEGAMVAYITATHPRNSRTAPFQNRYECRLCCCRLAAIGFGCSHHFWPQVPSHLRERYRLDRACSDTGAVQLILHV